ncbi:alpha/beta fold hydrolase [Bradyrhizobium sp. 23AC]
MGTRLCDIAGATIWGDRYSYTANRLKLLRLPISFDPKNLAIVPCGVLDQVSIIPLFWESNVYLPLRTQFRSLGYRSGGDCSSPSKGEFNLIDFGYDWRLSSIRNAELLKKCMDELFPGKTVDIVAHSAGGLVARAYVQAFGGAPRVHKLIFLGTPHQGSVEIFRRLTEGLESWPDSFAGGLSEIQRTILSFQSTYELLPTYEHCCTFKDRKNNKSDEFLAHDPSAWMRFSWLPPDIRNRPGFALIERRLSEAEEMTRLAAKPIFSDVNHAQPIFIANAYISTWSRLYFDATSGIIFDHTEVEGDKRVLLKSAANGDPDNFFPSHREHDELFVGQDPEKKLETALSDRDWTSASKRSPVLLEDASRRKYTLSGLDFSASSRLVEVDSTNEFAVTLFGDERLRQAELSHLNVTIIDADGNYRASIVKSDEAQGNANVVRKIVFSFTVPPGPGSGKIVFDLPGFAAFDEPILILERQ